MQERKFTDDIEKGALENTASKTMILYLLQAYVLFFVCSIILESALAVTIIFGIILCILFILLFFSIKADKKLIVSKSVKVHLCVLFFTSVFSAPAVAVLGLNGTDEFISGTPFSLISVIAFGYIALCLILGVPTVLIISSIRGRREEKAKQMKEAIKAQGFIIEEYDESKHGKVCESKGILPKVILIIGIIFALSGFAVTIAGVSMIFLEDVVLGIVIAAVLGIPFAISGIVICYIFFKIRADESIFEKTVQMFYTGEKAFVTTAKIISWSRRSRLMRQTVKYRSVVGFEFKYVFYDQNSKLRQAKGFIEVDSRNGFLTSIGVEQAQKREACMTRIDFEEINVVFNNEVSALLRIDAIATAPVN